VNKSQDACHHCTFQEGVRPVCISHDGRSRRWSSYSQHTHTWMANACLRYSILHFWNVWFFALTLKGKFIITLTLLRCLHMQLRADKWSDNHWPWCLLVQSRGIFVMLLLWWKEGIQQSMCHASMICACDTTLGHVWSEGAEEANITRCWKDLVSGGARN
jgi:hypothetical protein